MLDQTHDINIKIYPTSQYSLVNGASEQQGTEQKP